MIFEHLWHIKVAFSVKLLKLRWFLVLFFVKLKDLIVLNLKLVLLPIARSYQMVRLSFKISNLLFFGLLFPSLYVFADVRYCFLMHQCLLIFESFFVTCHYLFNN
jgi:hypothetical protein